MKRTTIAASVAFMGLMGLGLATAKAASVPAYQFDPFDVTSKPVAPDAKSVKPSISPFIITGHVAPPAPVSVAGPVSPTISTSSAPKPKR